MGWMNPFAFSVSGDTREALALGLVLVALKHSCGRLIVKRRSLPLLLGEGGSVWGVGSGDWSIGVKCVSQHRLGSPFDPF